MRPTSFARSLAGVALFTALSLARVAAAGVLPSLDPDDQPHAGAGLDSISPYNGQLNLMLPIGPEYVVGPNLSFQVRLHYSSRVWGPGKWAIDPNTNPPAFAPFMLVQGDPALGLGWRFSLGEIVESGVGVPFAYVASDGSAHGLYDRRFHSDSAADGFYYTRDGSDLRVKYLGAGQGYELRTPDGNVHTLARQVSGYDDVPASYITDYGRGRDGWYLTAITNPYGDAITVTYQTGAQPWVPAQITIPSNISGSTGPSRVVTVSMTNGLVSGFTMPTFGETPGSGSTTFSLVYDTAAVVSRPTGQSTQSKTRTVSLLTEVDLPVSGYKYLFTYNVQTTFPAPVTAYAQGAMSSQTIPTGATISYTYGTWTWYHVNPQNRPNACSLPPAFAGIYRVGPGIEPALPSLAACQAPDRAAGVVSRKVTLNDSSLPNNVSTTSYYQYSFPSGEQQSTPQQSESETLVVSPAGSPGDVTTTSYLFSSSNSLYQAGPLVGALLRTAVFAGDVSGTYASSTTDGPVCPNALFCTTNTSVKRIEKLTWDTDDHLGFTSTLAEANRRLTTRRSQFGPDTASYPKYHQVDYVFDSTAGRVSKVTHSGNISTGTTSGTDAREVETTFTPSIDATHWKLDKALTTVLRATAGGSAFATTTNTFDTQGFVTSTATLDGSGNSSGTLKHTFNFDGHGMPYTSGGSAAESFGDAATPAVYSRDLTFAAGTLATSQWRPTATISWKSVDDTVDPATGFVSKSRDPNGLETTYTYDKLGRPLVTTPPGGDAPTTITYDSPTQTTSVTRLSTQPAGQDYAWSQVITDKLGRTLKVRRKMPCDTPGCSTHPVAKKVLKYDARGRQVFESEWLDDAASETSPPGMTFGPFDPLSRPLTVTQADGQQITADYSDSPYIDSAWKKKTTVQVRTSSSASTPSSTTYRLDGLGNLVTVTDPASNDTTYTYNPQDRLTNVVQGSQTRTFAYDAFGFLRSETTPEKGTTAVTYTYDVLGNLLTSQEPTTFGQSLVRTYDAAGRLLTLKTSNQGQTFLSNCYDGAGTCASTGGTNRLGRLTQRKGGNYLLESDTVSADDVTETYSFDDPAGRLSQRTTTFSSGAVGPVSEKWFYDPTGAILSYSHPRPAGSTPFVVATTYDEGLPVALTGNGIPVVPSVSYQRSGALKSYSTGLGAGSNVTTTITPDSTGVARPGRITAALGASTLFDTGAYSYDGAGNIYQLGPAGSADTFVYDSLSRLTQASLNGLGSQSYAFDRWGNMTSKAGVSLPVDSSSNRLTGATYSTRGDLTAYSGDAWAYDYLNRITKFTPSGGSAWTYLYSGSGERVARRPPVTLGLANTYTFRDESNRVATELSGTAVSRDNVYLGRLLVASYSSCTVTGNGPRWAFYSSDHLGTPRLVTDVSGAVVDSRKYRPFGDEAAVTLASTNQRYRFAGMERDTEGSSYYDHARSHHFGIGRFLSVDPLFGTPNDPNSWNRYSYVLQNPLRFIDPTGLEAEADPDDDSNPPLIRNEEVLVTADAPSPEDYEPLRAFAPSQETITREEFARRALGGVYSLSARPVECITYATALATAPAAVGLLGGGLLATTVDGTTMLLDTVAVGDGYLMTATYQRYLWFEARRYAPVLTTKLLMEVAQDPSYVYIPQRIGQTFMQYKAVVGDAIWSIVINPYTKEIWHVGPGKTW